MKYQRDYKRDDFLHRRRTVIKKYIQDRMGEWEKSERKDRYHMNIEYFRKKQRDARNKNIEHYREKERERGKRFRERHPEKNRERQRRYYQKNRERICKAHKK